MDCTLGPGGHARLLLERIGPTGVERVIELADEVTTTNDEGGVAEVLERLLERGSIVQ